MPRFFGIVSAFEALAGGAIRSLAGVFRELGQDPLDVFGDRYPDLPAGERDTLFGIVEQSLAAGAETTARQLLASEQEPITPISPLDFLGEEGGDHWRYGIEIDWRIPGLGSGQQWLIEITAPLGVDAEDLMGLAEEQLEASIQQPGSPTFEGVDVSQVVIESREIVYQVRDE